MFWLRRGFTLVELMVVIAIIVILAGIIVPVAMSARHAARRTACLSNANASMLALTMQTNQRSDGKVILKQPYGNRLTWVEWVVAGGFLDTDKASRCPLEKHEARRAGSAHVDTAYGVFSSQDQETDFPVNVPDVLFSDSSANTAYMTYSYAFSPNKAVVLVESFSPEADGLRMNIEARMNSGDSFINFAHGGSSIVAFLDGHVEVVALDDWMEILKGNASKHSLSGSAKDGYGFKHYNGKEGEIFAEVSLE